MTPKLSMLRGIYAKIFLWFLLATFAISTFVFVFAVVMHAPSLGPRWMTGVLDVYARTAVGIYHRNGTAGLQEYLQEIEASSNMRATLLDPQGRDILGRGVPAGTEDVLRAARRLGRTRFRTDLRWRGAAVVPTEEGNYILVAQVRPLEVFEDLSQWITPGLRLAFLLLAGGLLSLVLARYLAAPIRALQHAAGRIADGDLSVRAAPAVAGRNDELADLAWDFDRMAERIQALLKKQLELLGEISHELRSPLTRLNVSLELVRRGETDAIEGMQADLERLDELIGQILTLTRLQAYSDQRAETAVSLRQMVESIARDAAFEGRTQAKGVMVAHADDCWTTGDPALLRSGVENIVRNAIQYTRPRSDVVISLHSLEEGGCGYARILVRDHGDGVPVDALPRLFEPFYRATNHASNGTGLGLSIAQRIVLLHQGTIAARNGEQAGLEIEIKLPARNSFKGRSG